MVDVGRNPTERTMISTSCAKKLVQTAMEVLVAPKRSRNWFEAAGSIETSVLVARPLRRFAADLRAVWNDGGMSFAFQLDYPCSDSRSQSSTQVFANAPLN
jgi:hypothetical protein